MNNGSQRISNTIMVNISNMKNNKYYYWILVMALTCSTLNMQAQEKVAQGAIAKAPAPAQNELMVRIAEIEIKPEHLEAYKSILQVEAAASVKLEPGVIAIFPMYEKEEPTRVRILEIYANKEAYEAHLKTPHFLHYKTETLKMVKSLRLAEMTPLDKETMPEIFKKKVPLR